MRSQVLYRAAQLDVSYVQLFVHTFVVTVHGVQDDPQLQLPRVL